MHVWIHVELILICPVVKRERKESTFAHEHHVGSRGEGVRVRVGISRVVPG